MKNEIPLMMKYDALKIKSKAFAVRIIRLCKYLKNEKHEYEMSHQIVKSGTSIGANISESEFAQSKADFITKMHIALKEASETRYWLELLFETEYIDDKSYESIYKDCSDLIAILVNTIKTAKSNLKRNTSVSEPMADYGDFNINCIDIPD